MKWRLMVGGLLAVLAQTAWANQDMSGTEIRKSITGKRVYLSVPFGGEFPLHYRRDGQVDGSGEALGLGRWVRPTDKGRWWVDGNRLCQKWETWYDGEVMCFTLQKLSDKTLKWVQNNGDKGTARIGE